MRPAEYIHLSYGEPILCNTSVTGVTKGKIYFVRRTVSNTHLIELIENDEGDLDSMYSCSGFTKIGKGKAAKILFCGDKRGRNS